MGWISTNRHGIPVKEFLASHLFSWPDNCKHKYTLLDMAIVKLKTCYAAVERIDGDTGERTVWAAVILLHYGATKHDSHDFGYKDMDETMGPNESECPARILDLLTPTDSEYANGWRARCRASIAKRHMAAHLATGSVIKLYDKKYRIRGSLGRDGYLVKREDNESEFRMTLEQARKCDVLELPPPPQTAQVQHQPALF